jgi:hypothetical protein
MQVAVTGHRDIDPHDAVLTESVAKQLESLRAQGGALTLLSCLAEGADRLVAHVGLSRFYAKLVAVLPLPVDRYEEDFHSDDSRRDFRKLLLRASQVVEIPGPFDGAGGRSVQYARAGAYLLVHGESLLALWDGQEPRGVGGTGMIVQWARDGMVPEEYRAGIGNPANPRKVIHIAVPSGEARSL